MIFRVAEFRVVAAQDVRELVAATSPLKLTHVAHIES